MCVCVCVCVWQCVCVCVLACLLARVCIQLCVCFIIPSFDNQKFSSALLWNQRKGHLLAHMVEFPPRLIPEHFCPLFICIGSIAQMGLIWPRWGLIVPRIPPPTPVLYSAVTNPFRGYVRTQSTPNPPKNALFSGPNLKVGKIITVWAKWTPTGQNLWKVGKSFLEVGNLLLLFMLLILQAFSLIFRSLALDFYPHGTQGTVSLHFIHYVFK